MSQFFVNSSGGGGPLPPQVPTQFNTQNGNAVPAANVLIINGLDSTQNNDNGIITKGGTPATANANEVDIVLTNRLQGTSSTSGVATTAIITFTPPTIGTYAIEVRIAAYNTTSSLGAAYSMFSGVRFDGANSVLCGTPDKIVNEEGTMTSANATITVSGANILVNGIGYAAQSINWGAVGLYTFIGA